MPTLTCVFLNYCTNIQPTGLARHEINKNVNTVEQTQYESSLCPVLHQQTLHTFAKVKINLHNAFKTRIGK